MQPQSDGADEMTSSGHVRENKHSETAKYQSQDEVEYRKILVSRALTSEPPQGLEPWTSALRKLRSTN